MRISERGSGLTSRQLLDANEQFKDGFVFIIHPLKAKDYYARLIKHLGIDSEKVIFQSINFINDLEFTALKIPVVIDHHAYEEPKYNIDGFLAMVRHNERVTKSNKGD